MKNIKFFECYAASAEIEQGRPNHEKTVRRVTDGKLVATVQLSGHLSTEASQTDWANLLAASPEMLRALKEIYAYVSSTSLPEGGKGFPAGLLVEAITKAEGSL